MELRWSFLLTAGLGGSKINQESGMAAVALVPHTRIDSMQISENTALTAFDTVSQSVHLALIRDLKANKSPVPDRSWSDR